MSTSDAVTDDAAGNERIFDVIGGGSAVLYVVIFSGVGALAFDDLVYGAIAGVLAGVGAFLFLPWFLRLQASQDDSDDETPFAENVRQAPGNAQLGVLGLGLELGSIVMLMAGFALAEPDLLIGTAVGLLVAASVSLVASVVL